MSSVTRLLTSRVTQFGVIPAVVLAWFLATDPSRGADTLLRIQLWSQALLITGIAYLIAKAFTGRASSEELYDQVLANNKAAGVAYLGVCILRATVLLALLVFFGLVQR